MLGLDMDFSKLDQTEKLATYGAIAVIVGGLVGFGAAGLGFLAVLAAAAMLAVVFLPQFSPGTNLPGSRGSLMLLLGGIAAVILVLGLLSVLGALGFMLQFAAVPTLFYLVAVAGGVLMAWAGWQAFQAEGGKFQLGGSSTSTARTDRADASAGAGSAAASGTTTGATTAVPTTSAPVAATDEERRSEP